MKESEIQDVIKDLAQRFADLDKNLNLPQLRASTDWASIVSELKDLMEDKNFFEVFFKNEFVNQGDSWKSASPLMPLFSKLGEFVFFPKAHIKRATVSFSDIFGCNAKEWRMSAVGFDIQVENLVKQQDKNFLGIFAFIEDEQYASFAEKFKNSPDGATALVSICDGVYTETVFLLKDKGEVLCLISGDRLPNHKAHLHNSTAKLFPEKSRKKCKGLFVNHNGDCSLHTELNINAVLYAALKDGSVFNTLVKLKNSKLDLDEMKLKFKDVSSHKLKNQPSDLTFCRWIAMVGKLFYHLECKSWREFCKSKSIHPFHGIKIDYNNWPDDEYLKIGFTWDAYDCRATINSFSNQHYPDPYTIKRPPLAKPVYYNEDVEPKKPVPSAKPVNYNKDVEPKTPAKFTKKDSKKTKDSIKIKASVKTKANVFPKSDLSDQEFKVAMNTVLRDIIVNIKYKRNKRICPFYKNKKILKLEQVKQDYDNGVLKTQQDILAATSKACAYKRNPFGFFKPKSLKEFNLKVGEICKSAKP